MMQDYDWLSDYLSHVLINQRINDILPKQGLIKRVDGMFVVVTGANLAMLRGESLEDQITKISTEYLETECRIHIMSCDGELAVIYWRPYYDGKYYASLKVAN